ncbi:hypothetical protein H2200_012916 [Cladophialophora chaetospira]|uniref:Uncharacterized protein n=1 Tax=Cladophialophora chaetospira TaxID=386627 RepID=A0AA39CC09_9EURO|nr:hypothetical protein H2200_012916 [Cladophialophora chaetospira]
MASSGPHGHDPTTCPEEIKKVNAEAKATQVLAQVEGTDKRNRGRTNYVHLALDNLPSSAEILGDPNPDDNTLFDSAYEAERYREALLERKNTVDPTIPTDPRDIKAHVKALFKAFKCVPDECEDTEKITKLYSDMTHDNALIEALCWQLVEGLIRRSEVKTNLVESYEPDKYKFRKCADKDFAERFDLLVEGMAKSKSLCKHLNDAPFMYKVLDDPLTNVERIESNRKLNGQKAEVMKRGKEVVAAEKDDGKNKKVKTRRSTEESPSVKTETAQPLRQRGGTTMSAQPPRYTTPQTYMRPAQYPNSAPANYGFMPANQQNPMNLNAGLMPYTGNNFFDTPTRRGGAQDMNSYNIGQQPAFGGQFLPPTRPNYGMLPPPQFDPLSATQFQGRQFATAAGVQRTASRSSNYPNMPAFNQNQTNTTWLPRAEADSGRPSSGHTSGASTVTAPEMENAEDAEADPFTSGHDDNANANIGYDQTDIDTLIKQAESENAGSEADDAAFENE